MIFDDPAHSRTLRARLRGWHVPTRHAHRDTTTFGVENRCTLRVSYGALQPETAIEGIGRLARGLRAIRS